MWTPAALKFVAWFRANLVLLIFGGMLILQAMTWHAIVDLRRYFPSSPPDCDYYRPCKVELTRDSTEDLARAIRGR